MMTHSYRGDSLRVTKRNLKPPVYTRSEDIRKSEGRAGNLKGVLTML